MARVGAFAHTDAATRLVFRRTHATSLVDAEEGLMDLIAGEVGFLADSSPHMVSVTFLLR